MRKVISVLATLPFVLFIIDLLIDFFDSNGVWPSSLVLGILGFLGLVSVEGFIRKSEWGRLGLGLCLLFCSVFFIVSGIQTYVEGDFLHTGLAIEFSLIGIIFIILAILTIFVTRQSRS